MLAFLALLPRALVTFLYALSAFLRFFAPSLHADELFPLLPRAGTDQALPSLLGWSVAAFYMASATLLVDLGLEWNGRNRARNRHAERRERQILRFDRETRFRRAVAELLLDPSGASQIRLRQLIDAEF